MVSETRSAAHSTADSGTILGLDQVQEAVLVSLGDRWGDRRRRRGAGRCFCRCWCRRLSIGAFSSGLLSGLVSCQPADEPAHLV
jgi:hypothetical protein